MIDYRMGMTAGGQGSATGEPTSGHQTDEGCVRQVSLVPTPGDGPAQFDLTVYIRQRSTSHALDPGKRLVVGRSRASDILVADDTVSRAHASITVHSGQVLVEDLGSNNGTQLVRGGKGPALDLTPGQPIPVKPGDLLRFGSVPSLVQKTQQAHLTMMGDGLTAPPNAREGALLREPVMKSLYALAGRAAQSEISVLIMGETGVGKERVASEIHRRSDRAAAPFVQINCAALSESLLESELFGHERGAFTGAIGRREGVFETARGGTLFLDEIGEMPLPIQAKLLRVLEQRSIRRLGSSSSLTVDVRFVAATNRDVQSEVQAGRFRRDLFFRIGGLVLSVPPLRERPLELEPLARHFLESFCLEMGISVPTLTEDGLAALREYPWPGNVRELKNAMERAPLLSGSMPIKREHLPSLEESDFRCWEEHMTKVTTAPGSRSRRAGGEEDTSPIRRLLDTSPQGLPPGASIHQPVSPASQGLPPEASVQRPVSPSDLRLQHANSGQYKPEDDRERILTALDACAGNQTRAAKLLGVSRRTLINRMDALGVPRPRKS